MNSNKLKSIMVAKGYTQERLAKEVNMSLSNFNLKINGRGQFDVREIVDICRVLHIDSSDDKCDIFLDSKSQ